jgi:hypothetical protein
MFMLDPIKGIFFHGGSCYVLVLFANQVYKNIWIITASPNSKH